MGISAKTRADSCEAFSESSLCVSALALEGEMAGSLAFFRNLTECHKTLFQKRDIHGGLQISQGT